MKSKIRLDIEIEHDGSSTDLELANGLREFIEDKSEPDDFGVSGVEVVSIDILSKH